MDRKHLVIELHDVFIQWQRNKSHALICISGKTVCGGKSSGSKHLSALFPEWASSIDDIFSQTRRKLGLVRPLCSLSALLERTLLRWGTCSLNNYFCLGIEIKTRFFTFFQQDWILHSAKSQSNINVSQHKLQQSSETQMSVQLKRSFFLSPRFRAITLSSTEHKVRFGFWLHWGRVQRLSSLCNR